MPNALEAAWNNMKDTPGNDVPGSADAAPQEEAAPTATPAQVASDLHADGEGTGSDADTDGATVGAPDAVKPADEELEEFDFHGLKLKGPKDANYALSEAYDNIQKDFESRFSEARKLKDDAKSEMEKALLMQKEMQAVLDANPEFAQKWNAYNSTEIKMRELERKMEDKLSRFEASRAEAEAESRLKDAVDKLDSKFKLPDTARIDQEDLRKLALNDAMYYHNDTGKPVNDQVLYNCYKHRFDKEMEKIRGKAKAVVDKVKGKVEARGKIPPSGGAGHGGKTTSTTKQYKGRNAFIEAMRDLP